MDAGSNDGSTVQVKEEASKPENRRKLKEFGQRFMKKRQPRRGPQPIGWWLPALFRSGRLAPPGQSEIFLPIRAIRA
jgi:hypothetical protein